MVKYYLKCNLISIKGKNALITGASSGIGQACASAFAASGSNVILGARRIKKLQKIAQEISEKYGVETFAAYMDVRDYKSLEKTIAALPEQFQVINFLLNCAGLALGMNTVYDANIEDFNTMVDTNEKGVYNMT
ncbi:MAG TPA: SDR family NAD(P)-dependent oxidoreductase, partial [Atribacterota bacterium]|nr:SDR family NAD(P)-dependent oxidoreductase [Atribacterota bacterium]